MFVDRMIGAVSTGRQIDAVVGGSESISKMAAPYLSGEKDALQLLGDSLGGLGAGGVANLTLAGLLGVLAGKLGGDAASGLSEVVETLKAKGLDGIDLSSLTTSNSRPK
jgi:hypothetical protein